MARGNSGGDANLKMIFIKITGLKEGEKVHMKQTESIGDKQYRELPETINRVSGTLQGVKIREHMYKGDSIKELQVMLKDTIEGEMYSVSVGINSLGRGLINTLLSLQEPYGNLEIRVYNKKDTGRAAIYIEHNGEKAGWKYSPEDQKQYITENTVSKKGKMVIEKDYFRLDEFFLNELKTKFKIAQTTATQPGPVTADMTGVTTDDLPF